MHYKNRQRNLVKIILEICSENNIQCNLLSEDWIIELQQEGVYHYIFGYNFELNPSAAQMIAQDKCATYEVLKTKNIPVAAHHLFMKASLHSYFDGLGNWEKMLQFFRTHNEKIICKPTSGTGGNNVFLVESVLDLEDAIQQLFTKHRSIALSPFYKIEKEYRIIILNGEALLIYTKQIPFVIGDGQSSIHQLINNTFPATQIEKILQKIERIDLESIPVINEKVDLQWKHNLGILAKPIIITDEQLKGILSNIARNACSAINIRFASVDIIKTEEGFKVLEINSGVMMETFSRASEENYTIAKEIYQKAISSMW